MNYTNPIIPGFHPDPSICRDGDEYYLVTSSFEYLPGVPLFHSTNLVQWEQVGHCLTRPSQIDIKDSRASGGIFAPTIRFHEGRFYMITTNINQGTFYVTRDRDAQEWSDPIFLNPHVWGIDPSLYFEEGHVYVQMAGMQKGIIQFEIDITTGNIISDVLVISIGSGGRDVEAPHLYQRNGLYYLLCAEGGTREGHMVSVQRSDSLWGPYESCPRNPILSNRDQGRNPLQGVGHGDLIQDAQGDWWMVALAYRPYHHKHVLGRETILLPVEWDEDGWPVVHKGYAEVEMSVDRPVSLSPIALSTRDDFDQTTLGYEWNYLREFTTCYSLTKHPGFLVITGNEHTLQEEKSPAFIARRQQHQHFSMDTYLEVSCQAECDEAGMSVYMDPTHHMELSLVRTKEAYRIQVRKCVGELNVISTSIPYASSKVYLMISGDTTQYHFYYGEQKETMQEIDATLCAHVSTEVAESAFTGVYVGLYGYGKVEAAFDYVNYQPKKS